MYIVREEGRRILSRSINYFPDCIKLYFLLQLFIRRTLMSVSSEVLPTFVGQLSDKCRQAVRRIDKCIGKINFKARTD